MAFETGTAYATADGAHEVIIDEIRPASFVKDGTRLATLFPLVGRVRKLDGTPSEWRLCCWTHEGRWGTSGNPYHLDIVRL